MSNIDRRALVAGIATAAAAAAVTADTAKVAAATAVEDHAAVLARAEQVVNILRNCYVCHGWKLDEGAAARSLRYLRSLADGSPDDDEEERAFTAFVYDHGQSRDWILDGNLSGLVARAASHSKRAAASDPIFAAIKEHRTAQAVFDAASDVPMRFEDPRREEHEEQLRVPGDQAHDKLITVLTTTPTTVGGLAALVGYVANCDERGVLVWDRIIASSSVDYGTGYQGARALLWTLEESLDRITAQLGTALHRHVADALEEITGNGLAEGRAAS